MDTTRYADLVAAIPKLREKANKRTQPGARTFLASMTQPVLLETAQGILLLTDQDRSQFVLIRDLSLTRHKEDVTQTLASPISYVLGERYQLLDDTYDSEHEAQDVAETEFDALGGVPIVFHEFSIEIPLTSS